MQRFLSDARSEAHALKRGGGVRMESMDVDGEYADASCGAMTPERAFEHAWALAVIDAAFKRLRAEAERAGKLALFDSLSDFLIERPDERDYAGAAATLNLRRNTVAVAVHRLRCRLRELVRDELGGAAASGGEVDVELQALRESLGGGAP